MPIERLEINRFADSGELVRRVSCVAGRVTVFRANSQELLSAYEDALCGRKTRERFEISVDGAPLRTSEHIFVGFGEQLPSDVGLTVRTYLESRSASAAKAGSSPGANIPGTASKGIELLERAGCRDLADRRLLSLSASDQHVLKLIVGLLDSTRVLVLSDPFLPLDPSSCEQLATMITSFAWREQGLVIVTQMSGRPETWIENPHIVRTQLERPRQATIGFGADGATELVDRLRKGLLQPEQPVTETGSAVAPEARPAPMTRDPRAHLVRKGSSTVPGDFTSGSSSPAEPFPTFTALGQQIAALLRSDRRAQVGSLVIVMVLILFLQKKNDNSVVRPLPTPTRTSTPIAKIPTSQIGPVTPVEVAIGEEAPPKHGVDAYPEAVRQALLLSFSDPGKALAQQKVSFPKLPAVEQKVIPASRPPAPSAFQRAPVESESADNNDQSHEPPPPGPPPFALPQGVGNPSDRPALSAEELEQRRQYIRQALLDAIQRRSQQMYGNPAYEQGQ